MPTAFVLSGGGNLGAVQVGMLKALAEHGVRPDMVFGTSVGAINAAFLAGRPSEIDELGAIWCAARRAHVFPTRTLGLLAGLSRRSHLCSPGGLRDLIRSSLNYERLEDAALPISVVATSVVDGEEVVLSRGAAVEAVAASAAIPGVFPPVEIDGQLLMDGAVANNTPISCAIHAGASPIYVLATGFACALPSPPRSALAMALHSVTLLVQQRLMADVRRFQDDADLRVVPPQCPIDISPLDFGKSRQLIDRSYQTTANWLEAQKRDTDQSGMLAFHHH